MGDDETSNIINKDKVKIFSILIRLLDPLLQPYFKREQSN